MKKTEAFIKTACKDEDGAIGKGQAKQYLRLEEELMTLVLLVQAILMPEDLEALREVGYEDLGLREQSCSSGHLRLGLAGRQVEPPFQLTIQELRKSDVKLLRDSYLKLKMKIVGPSGILSRPNGDPWVSPDFEEDSEGDEGQDHALVQQRKDYKIQDYLDLENGFEDQPESKLISKDNAENPTHS